MTPNRHVTDFIAANITRNSVNSSRTTLMNSEFTIHRSWAEVRVVLEEILFLIGKYCLSNPC
jgi:hypothetical protein